MVTTGLPAWIPDALCRLATGGGFAVRQLYTDQDEVLFEAPRARRRRPHGRDGLRFLATSFVAINVRSKATRVVINLVDARRRRFDQPIPGRIILE